MKPLVFFLSVMILATVSLAGCSDSIHNYAPPASIPAQTSGSGKYSVNFTQTPGYALPDIVFDLSETKLDLPDKINVYKMVKPEISRDYIATLATKFGLNAKIGPGSYEGFSIQDNTTGAFLSVYAATGTIYYTWPAELNPKNKPSLPSDEEARKIATDFLSGLGFLSEGDVASSVIAGGNAGYGTTNLIVNFSRVIKVNGPGARQAVRIGDNGKIVAVYVNPTNPVNLPIEEAAPAKTLNEACQEMLANKTYSAIYSAKTVKITGFQVVYWLNSIEEFQEYVVPVYKFTGDCFDRSGKAIGGFMGNCVAVN